MLMLRLYDVQKHDLDLMTSCVTVLPKGGMQSEILVSNSINVFLTNKRISNSNKEDLNYLNPKILNRFGATREYIARL